MGLISNGTTIFDNGSMASGFGGSLNFISKQTASSSSSINFTTGIDSTYKEYIFYFVDLHPSTGDNYFEFNMSTDGGSSYNVTKTTTFFRVLRTQTGGTNVFAYLNSDDLAQGTGYQVLSEYGNANAEDSGCGYLHLFNPSSTTFVKNYYSHIHYRRNYTSESHASAQNFSGGYGNTTSAVNAISFRNRSGTIDSGDIILFGVS